MINHTGKTKIAVNFAPVGEFIRAERRAGEMLKGTELNTGAMGIGKVQLHDVTALPKLDELDITKIQPHRWQLEARLRYDYGLTERAIVDQLHVHKTTIHDWLVGNSRTGLVGNSLTLMQGDCLEELKKLPDKSVDCLLTDPPYSVRLKKRPVIYRHNNPRIKELVK